MISSYTSIHHLKYQIILNENQHNPVMPSTPFTFSDVVADVLKQVFSFVCLNASFIEFVAVTLYELDSL